MRRQLSGGEVDHLAVLLHHTVDLLARRLKQADSKHLARVGNAIIKLADLRLERRDRSDLGERQFLQLLVDGRSTVTEKIYPARFMHAAELQRMGAEIAIDGATAAIYGDRPLSGAPVMASDLRASAALILAALIAKGETWVQRLYHLDRGYERFEERLRSLGADVERLPASELPKGFAED